MTAPACHLIRDRRAHRLVAWCGYEMPEERLDEFSKRAEWTAAERWCTCEACLVACRETQPKEQNP